MSEVGPSVLASRQVPFASFCDTDGFSYKKDGASKHPDAMGLCPRGHHCDGCNAYRAIYEGTLVLNYEPSERDKVQALTRRNV